MALPEIFQLLNTHSYRPHKWETTFLVEDNTKQNTASKEQKVPHQDQQQQDQQQPQTPYDHFDDKDSSDDERPIQQAIDYCQTKVKCRLWWKVNI